MLAAAAAVEEEARRRRRRSRTSSHMRIAPSRSVTKMLRQPTTRVTTKAVLLLFSSSAVSISFLSSASSLAFSSSALCFSRLARSSSSSARFSCWWAKCSASSARFRSYLKAVFLYGYIYFFQIHGSVRFTGILEEFHSKAVPMEYFPLHAFGTKET